ncbi:MAG TPA: hypothetical protein VN578_17580 [Candidatus Binatia bacterium]|jgi:hypothetical protein|nr:hypothetical protein [Candidatus Binatia bacterium]
MALPAPSLRPVPPKPALAAGGPVAAVLLAATLFASLAGAAQPVISLIERYSSNQVLLHFDTEANRTYTLQYSTNSPVASNALWFPLYVAPSAPFPDHYIVPDTATSRQRFYRLSVTP